MRAWGSGAGVEATRVQRPRSRTPPRQRGMSFNDGRGKGCYDGYDKGWGKGKGGFFDDYMYGGKGYGDPYLSFKGYYGKGGFGGFGGDIGYEHFGGGSFKGSKGKRGPGKNGGGKNGGGKDGRRGKGGRDRRDDGPAPTAEGLDADLDAYFTGKRPAERKAGGKREEKKDDPNLGNRLDKDLESYMKDSKGGKESQGLLKAEGASEKEAQAAGDALAAEADKDLDAKVVEKGGAKEDEDKKAEDRKLEEKKAADRKARFETKPVEEKKAEEKK